MCDTTRRIIEFKLERLTADLRTCRVVEEGHIFEAINSFMFPMRVHVQSLGKTAQPSTVTYLDGKTGIYYHIEHILNPRHLLTLKVIHPDHTPIASEDTAGEHEAVKDADTSAQRMLVDINQLLKTLANTPYSDREWTVKFILALVYRDCYGERVYDPDLNQSYFGLDFIVAFKDGSAIKVNTPLTGADYTVEVLR